MTTPANKRPDHERTAEAVARDVGVGRTASEVQPSDHRGDQRRRERGHHDGQGEAAVEDLGGEDGTPEGHVVDAGQSRAAAAGHEQPPLRRAQIEPVRDHAARRAAHQLRRGLPSDRRTESDDDFGDHRRQHAPAKRQFAVTVPDRVVDVGPLVLEIPPDQVPRHRADHAADQQDHDPPTRTHRGDRVLEVAASGSGIRRARPRRAATSRGHRRAPWRRRSGRRRARTAA